MRGWTSSSCGRRAWDAPTLSARAQALRLASERRSIRFVVNDELWLARDCGADALHLGQDDLPIEEARRELGPDFLIGLSTHSEDQIRRAAERGASMIGVGPIFATQTKKEAGPAKGLDLVEASSRLAPELPAFPIGGIDASNAEEVIARGGAGVAVSSAILGAEDPARAVEELRAALERGYARRL